MESFAYGSLAQIRILLLPIGNIRRTTFEKWVQVLKEIDIVRLGDLTTDVKDERCTSGLSRLLFEGSSARQLGLCPIINSRPVTCI